VDVRQRPKKLIPPAQAIDSFDSPDRIWSGTRRYRSNREINLQCNWDNARSSNISLFIVHSFLLGFNNKGWMTHGPQKMRMQRDGSDFYGDGKVGVNPAFSTNVKTGTIPNSPSAIATSCLSMMAQHFVDQTATRCAYVTIQSRSAKLFRG
jgi:hypothetical protein